MPEDQSSYLGLRVLLAALATIILTLLSCFAISLAGLL